jgi:hypothetical protein
MHKYMRVALVCLGAAVISGCYSGGVDPAATQAGVDFERQEAQFAKQRQEAVEAYRSKFSYLAYDYTVRLYKTELKADGTRVKSGQSIQEFVIFANGGEVTGFRFDTFSKPSAEDKSLDETELVYVRESHYGNEFDLTSEAQEKHAGSIEFKIDPNLPYARGRVYVSVQTKRLVGVTKVSTTPTLMTGNSSVAVGDFQLALTPKEGDDSRREGKKELVVGAFFVEFGVTALGKLKPEDVPSAIPKG